MAAPFPNLSVDDVPMAPVQYPSLPTLQLMANARPPLAPLPQFVGPAAAVEWQQRVTDAMQARNRARLTALLLQRPTQLIDAQHIAATDDRWREGQEALLTMH